MKSINFASREEQEKVRAHIAVITPCTDRHHVVEMPLPESDYCQRCRVIIPFPRGCNHELLDEHTEFCSGCMLHIRLPPSDILGCGQGKHDLVHDGAFCHVCRKCRHVFPMAEYMPAGNDELRRHAVEVGGLSLPQAEQVEHAVHLIQKRFGHMTIAARTKLPPAASAPQLIESMDSWIKAGNIRTSASSEQVRAVLSGASFCYSFNNAAWIWSAHLAIFWLPVEYPRGEGAMLSRITSPPRPPLPAPLKPLHTLFVPPYLSAPDIP